MTGRRASRVLGASVGISQSVTVTENVRHGRGNDTGRVFPPDHGHHFMGSI